MVDQNKGFVGGVTLVSLDLLIHLTHALICPHSFLFTFFGTSSLIWYCVTCPNFPHILFCFLIILFYSSVKVIVKLKKILKHPCKTLIEIISIIFVNKDQLVTLSCESFEHNFVGEKDMNRFSELTTSVKRRVVSRSRSPVPQRFLAAAQTQQIGSLCPFMNKPSKYRKILLI